MTDSALPALIDAAFERRAEFSPKNAPAEVRDAVEQAITLLDSGKAASPRSATAQWHVNPMAQESRAAGVPAQRQPAHRAGFTQFYDKVALEVRGSRRCTLPQRRCRVVPHAIVRRGAYIAPNAVLMPSYVNVGAYVGEGTMVDTWATVGSCAQVGRNVHLSGGAGLVACSSRCRLRRRSSRTTASSVRAPRSSRA
jgi:2,3,4,5-tetrahydropyridine-2-carboxylate N-succinyltransferase